MNYRQRLGFVAMESALFALLLMIMFDYQLSDFWLVAIAIWFVIGTTLFKL